MTFSEVLHKASLFTSVLILISTMACTALPGKAVSIPPCPSATTPDQCFSQPEDAPSGMAKLYVFRPNLSDNYTKDNPVLIIDNALEMTLSRWSYAPFDLALGKHRFKLTAGMGDSRIWNLEGEFDVKAVGRYYLAIWSAMGTKSKTKSSSAASPGLGAGLGVGLATTIMTGGVFTVLVFPALGPNFREYSKYELIDEQQALESIRQCKLSN